MRNALMQEIVAFETDRITKVFCFEKLVDLGIGKGRIPTEEPFNGLTLVSAHDRLQHRSPIMSAMNVSPPQGGPLQVPVLIEAKERMVTRSPKVSVIRRAFLLPMGRAF